MPKVRYDDWYLDDSCEKFIKEIEFVYDTYINNIKDIYNTPEIEADNYTAYLEQNSQELEALDADSAIIEIQSKAFERYYFVMNMKYRNLAIYIDLIYQMLEQFIISICKFQQTYHSYDSEVNSLNCRSLHTCNTIFKKYGFDFESKIEYSKINELRLLQNVLKHSEGESQDELKLLRPDYFNPPNKIISLYKNTIIDATLNISDKDLHEYVIAIKKFLKVFPDKLVHGYNC